MPQLTPSQWTAALVAALPQIIIDLLIYTLIYGSEHHSSIDRRTVNTF